jgi:glycosyltransferase involved in cell wall biosynthesis
MLFRRDDITDIKVSVITVCLNCRNDVRATMESIFSQSCENVECIVVDGGSTDGTKEFLESVRDRLSVLISESDKGIYDAMNKGIMASSGDYIIFMNAGDRFAHRDALRTVMTDPDVMKSRPKIISGRIRFEYGGRLMNLYRPRAAGREGPGLPHQATFVDGKFHRENLFDARFRFVGDYELWRRLQARGLFDVKYIDAVISTFSFGGVSTNPRLEARHYMERAYVDSLYSKHFGLVDWARIFMKLMMRRIALSIMGDKMFFVFLRKVKGRRT